MEAIEPVDIKVKKRGLHVDIISIKSTIIIHWEPRKIMMEKGKESEFPKERGIEILRISEGQGVLMTGA